MTPLDTNSILRLLKATEAATAGEWAQRDTCVYVGEKLLISAWPSRKSDEAQEAGECWLDMRHRTKPERDAIESENRSLAAYIAACDPTTISAICRLALEGVAMRRAVSDEHDAINDMRKQDGNSDWKEGYESGLLGVARRTSELLAAIEKGEATYPTLAEAMNLPPLPEFPKVRP